MRETGNQWHRQYADYKMETENGDESGEKWWREVVEE